VSSGPDLATAELLAPDYGGLCLDAVLPAVTDALGVSVDVGGRTGAQARELLELPRADRVCVVLVDGLGQQQLTERSRHAPFLRSLLPDGLVLTTGFPSTTATSMGLFGTGRPAGRTGLAGYTVRVPGTGELMSLVSWDGPVEPRELQTAPTLFEQVAAAGVAVASVGPGEFAGSGLTEAALRGGRYLPAASLAQRVDQAVQALEHPGLVYLYWGDVDRVGHHEGWTSVAWGEEVAAADRELRRLARSVPAGTLLVVTADHGMIDVDRGLQVDVAATPLLSSGVRVVAGEPRALHVHVEDGQARPVVDRWRTVLGTSAVVLTRDEAEAAGWFGSVSEHVRELLGDVVVAATGRASVVDSRTQSAASMRLIGMHGSLTPGEMQVPLLVTQR